MEAARKSFLTNQIISGIRFVKIEGERYKIVPPSLEVKLLAEYVYKETVESLRFDNFMSNDQVKSLLNRLQKWAEKDDVELGKLETWLEDQKVVLYRAAFDIKSQEKARINIERAKKSIHKALSRKHFLDHTMLEHHALITKCKFIVALCLRDKNNDSLYTEESFWSSDSHLLEQAINALEQETVSIEEFRSVARSDPWKTIWGAGKEHCFGVSSSEWTDDQRTLVIFSKMYENAQQSLECPSDEVMEDDDMFDGWMIDMRRKREEEMKKKQTDAVNTTNYGNAGEIFIMADTVEDADRIYDLNETNQRRTIKERSNMIKRKGRVDAANLPDTQRDLTRQAASQYKSKKI